MWHPHLCRGERSRGGREKLKCETVPAKALNQLTDGSSGPEIALCNHYREETPWNTQTTKGSPSPKHDKNPAMQILSKEIPEGDSLRASFWDSKLPREFMCGDVHQSLTNLPIPSLLYIFT